MHGSQRKESHSENEGESMNGLIPLVIMFLFIVSCSAKVYKILKELKKEEE